MLRYFTIKINFTFTLIKVYFQDVLSGTPRIHPPHNRLSASRVKAMYVPAVFQCADK